MTWQNREMSPSEYRKAIHILRLKKAQAGRYLGVSVRTAHRYWDGDVKVPPASAMLLRALLHFKEQPEVHALRGHQGQASTGGGRKTSPCPIGQGGH